MREILIACETLRLEVEEALRHCGRDDIDVQWVSSDLHDSPSQLHDELQGRLDALIGVHAPQRVLLCFTECGGATKGLETGGYLLTMPRADDCITLLLGSRSRRDGLVVEGPAYFMTKGWTQGKASLVEQHRYSLAKYGPEMTGDIFAGLLRSYRRIDVIDTGCFDANDLASEIEGFAESVGLAIRIVQGRLDWLEQLVNGPWPDDRFITVGPYGRV